MSVDVPVVVAGHRWLWLGPRSASVTLNEMAAALATHGVMVWSGDDAVVVDDRLVPSHHTLVQAGVRAGAHLGPGEPGAVEMPIAGWIDVVVTAGDGAGVLYRLPPGRFLLGSAEGLVLRLGAGHVVPHAGVVHVAGHRRHPVVTVTHLAGPPFRVDGESAGDGDHTLVWPAHVSMTVGGARLRWTVNGDAALIEQQGRLADAEPRAHAVWWRVHQRWGRPPSRVATDAQVVDQPSDVSAPPLAPGMAAAATSVVMATVVGQPWLALVGVSSLVATSGWWLSARMRSRRRRARWAAAQHRQHERLAQCARLGRPALHELVAMAEGHRAGLWERRPQRHDDVWQVGLGWGHERRRDGRWWHEVPVVVSLEVGARIGVTGAGAVSLARAMMAHLVTQVGSRTSSRRSLVA